MVAKKEVPAAVNAWDAQLAAFAVEAAGQESGGGSSFVSTRGGRLSFGGNEVPGNKMNVVVVAAVAENHYYVDRFDADNPASPVCFAYDIGDGTEMKPHENSSNPQSETCAKCPKNVFGSADTGKGKACKNIRRLGLITEDGVEDVNAAELAVLKIPVTSVKNWSTYVSSVASTLKRPPFAVVTEVSCAPDSKTQFKVNFKLAGQITDGEALQALMGRREAVITSLTQPYAPHEEVVEQAPKAQGKRKY